MTTVYVLLNSIAKVKEFVTITSRCPYDIDVCSRALCGRREIHYGDFQPPPE